MYHFFRQLWLVLGVKLMEINSNLFSRDSLLKVQIGPFLNIVAQILTWAAKGMNWESLGRPQQGRYNCKYPKDPDGCFQK